MPEFPENFSEILEKSDKKTAELPKQPLDETEVDQEWQQRPESVQPRERSLLERLRGQTKTWALASSFLLVTGITEMISRFSHATQIDTKAHATEILHKIEGMQDEKISPVITMATETTAEPTEENEGQERYQSYLKNVKQDPNSFLLWMEDIKNEPFAMDLAHEALRLDPFLFIGHWDTVQASFDNPGALAETMLKADPSILLKTDDKTREFFSRVLQKSPDERLKLSVEISHLDLSDAEKAKLMALIPLLHSGRMTIEQASRTLNDQEAYREALMTLLPEGGEFAQLTFNDELSGAFVQNISEMNSRHNETHAKRFESIKSYSPKELYALLISDAGDVKNNVDPLSYPSTYQGVFDRLLEGMKQEKLSGTDLLVSVGSYQLDGFVRVAVERGRFDDFLSTIEFDERIALIESLLGDISTQVDVSIPTGIMADVLRQTKDAKLKSLMIHQIKERFLSTPAESGDLRRAYGVLSVLADPEASWIPQDERAEYVLPDQSTLETKELESNEGVVVERYFFYDDEDGATSYRNFLDSFQGKSGWKIDQKPGYVIVSSTGQKRSVKIYANEPSTGPNEDNPDRQDAVEKVFEAQGIEPTVVVHRGHVYHQDRTLERLPASTKLLVLGSCGGFAKVDSIMTEHDGIQVLSTKGTGTKLVNDTVLRALEGEMQTEDRLVWKDLWSDLSKKLGNNIDFHSYVPPDQNFHPLVASKIRANRV